MQEPRLRTVFVDFHRGPNETVMVRYEFEEKYPMYHTELGLSSIMPQPMTYEVDQFIPMYDLRRYGALKMAEIFTERAWHKACGYFNTHPRYLNTSTGVHEVGELLSNPGTRPYHRMMVRDMGYHMRVVENPYLRPGTAVIGYEQNYNAMLRTAQYRVFPPLDIDSTINDAFKAMNLEMEKFMGGFAATTTCSTGKESQLTLAAMEKALETLGVPCRGKRGSKTLYIGNGTAPIKKYKTKGGQMSYISKLGKRLLDADTKSLIKAGFLDSELDLTECGVQELLAIVFESNRAELVKAAKAKIKEAKDNE